MPPHSTDELVIESLDKSHDRKSFDCGNALLNEYLRRHAIKNTEYGFGKAYAVVRAGEKRIWAFCTLSAAHVDASRFQSYRGCPRYISVVLMGRLAVDQQIQRIGVGQLLMGHTFQMALEAAEKIGVHAILVEAKDESARDYYRRYGFHSLMDNPLHLYLPINLIPRP